jgi:ATPase components of ABC transporters with duplicated ATPase domains
MLQITNMSAYLTKDMRPLIKNFNFVLNKGDKAVIIGEEGNGKSTLLKLIYDPESIASNEALDYIEYSGNVYTGNDRLGYLAQEMPVDKHSLTLYEYFTAIPSFYNLTPKELSDIANQLSFDNELFYSDQMVSTLSGGEKVKLQLAAILIEQPDILLLDEPSNDIDIGTLEWLEKFINTCGLPILFVSHDETLIENTANVIIHLEQVRKKTVPRYTIAKMPYAQYISERVSSLEHQEQMARKERDEYEKQMARWQQIYERVKHEQNAISRQDPGGGRLLKKKMKSVKSQEHRYEREKENMTQIPDVEEAIFMYFDESIYVPNGKTVIDYRLDKLTIGDRLLAEDIHMNLTGGYKVVIIGDNGTGKTTLLRQIAEELLQRTDIKAAYMPQNYSDLLDFSQTPIDFLSPSGHKDDITKARTYLGSMKYTSEEMEHEISDLSGGQKAKLLFIKMILDGCNVLILDEPTRNFSPMSNPVIRQVLQNYRGTIISVSHDRKYISEVCDTIYKLENKRVIKC